MCNSTTTKQLFSVAQAFEECDPHYLVDFLIDNTLWSSSDELSKQRPILLKKVKSILKIMSNITQSEAFQSDLSNRYLYHALSTKDEVDSIDKLSNRLIILWDSYDVSHDGRFVRKKEARIVNLNRLNLIQCVIDKLGGRINSYDIDITDTFSTRKLQSLMKTDFVSTIDTLIDVPWISILKMKILLPNECSLEDYYCLLENIFWSMTFSTFGIKDLLDYPIKSYDLSNLNLDNIYSDLANYLDNFLDVLNYNSWVSTVEAISAHQIDT